MLSKRYIIQYTERMHNDPAKHLQTISNLSIVIIINFNNFKIHIKTGNMIDNQCNFYI